MKGLLKRILSLGTALGMIISMVMVYPSVFGAEADIIFDFEDNTTGGFEARNASTELSVENGDLKVITQAADTGIKLSGDIGIVPDEHKYVHIRMKRAADSVATSWLFQVANTSNWSTAATLNSYTVANAADVDSEGYFTETVSFEGKTFPEGANYFRFDPNRGKGYEAGTYYIDYIAISANAEPPKMSGDAEIEQSITEDFEDSTLNITPAAVRQGVSSLVELDGKKVQKWAPKTPGSPANVDGVWATGFEAQTNKSGKLTYEFDVLIKRGTGEETADRVMNICTSPEYDSNKGAKGVKVSVVRPAQVWSGTEDWQNKAAVTAEEWISMKLEFDYSNGKLVYKGWANGSEFTKGADGGVDITSALDSYDPYNGLYITMYTPGNSVYYIDNFKVTYRSAQQEVIPDPEMIMGISVSGVEVDGFDYKTLNYDIKVAESNWNVISAENIVVAKNTEYEDAEVDVQVGDAQDGIKKVTITVASGEFSQTYVVNCLVLPELSEAHNSWEWEDFEDSTVSAMIGNEPLDNAKSELTALKGRKVQKWGFKEKPTNNSARWTLKPSLVLNRPMALMGKLTYEFEILFPETNPLENESNPQSQYVLPITLDNAKGDKRITLVYLRPHVAKNGAGKGDLPLSEPFGWHNVKIVFDYSQTEPVYSTWVDGAELEQNVKYDAENYNPYEKGIEFRAWVPNTFEYYVDNVGVSYIEAQPEAVEKITVSGKDVADLNGDKYEYTHGVYEDLYENLGADDVKVVLNKDFENADVKVNLAETEGVKRMLIDIKQYPYSYT
ncbi:MAG: hypothetical protein U0M60_01895, partial [Clostridia bacterium]|nr:hypothetical protein [Clostridia bacterium]